LQGYKPAYQLSTEQVRSHFPDWVKYFTDSLLLETIGKKTTQAGQTIYIDTPANWQAFWQNIPNNSAQHIESTGRDNDKFENPKTTIWKTKAWEIGETWLSERRNEGEDPGGNAVAKHVEAELSRLGIPGPRGYFLDWQTVKRQALKGITDKQANGKGQKRRKQTGDSPAR